MNKFFLGFALLLIGFKVQGQSEIQWINEHALSLEHDLSFLSSELKGKTVVALGEASHGTHEFYLHKGHIIQYLIKKLEFKSVGFEYSESVITPINQYLQDGKGDLKRLMKGLHLYNTTEIFDVFQWIKNYNESQKAENRISVFGYDREEFQYDPLNRDKYMATTAVEFLASHPGKSVIWAHNVHIAKDTTMAQFEAMGSHLKKEYGDAYYALCFDTFRGSVNIWDEGKFESHTFEAEQKTFSDLLAKARPESFFLSFRAKANPLLGQRNHITNINSNWQVRKSLPIRPGADFDGVVFIRVTSPSIQLKN